MASITPSVAAPGVAHVGLDAGVAGVFARGARTPKHAPAAGVLQREPCRIFISSRGA